MQSRLRLVDLAQTVMSTQAELLKLLTAVYGEDEAVRLLEDSEPSEGLQALEDEVLRGEWFDISELGLPAEAAASYSELETHARELGLSERLEFHLWAFPGYRAMVESAIPLPAVLRPRNATQDPLSEVLRLLQRFFEEWLRSLPLKPDQHSQWSKRLESEWLKLRTSIYKRSGRPTLQGVGSK